MLLKVNSCSPNTSEPIFYKEKYRIQKIFWLQYIQSKRTFTTKDEPESLPQLPELLDLPAFSPF
jgi:hypothetical protein